MSHHPLRLRKRLLLLREVADTRFELMGEAVIHRVRLKDGSSGHGRADVAECVHASRTLGFASRLEPWIDGPPFPGLFDGLSAEELAAIERLEPCADGLQRTLVQLFPFLTAVRCAVVGPGRLQLTLESDASLTETELKQSEYFARAALALMAANVTVVFQRAARAAPRSHSSVHLRVELDADTQVDAGELRALSS